MKSFKKLISALLCIIMMFSILPIGIIDVEAASPKVTINTKSEHYSIGETNAVLCGEVSNPNKAKVSKLGIKLYNASGNLLKEHSESSTFTVTTVSMWFNINTEVGYTLKKGTTYKYQLYAVVGGTTYTSSMTSFTTADRDTAQTAIMPLRKIYVTQKAGGSYSHAGTKNVDFGKSQNLYAPFDCKVVYKDTSYGGGNTIIIESTSKVKFADGTYDYMSVLTAHDNDISDLSKGTTIKQGTVYYHTGTYGNVTGEHVHMCVAKGKYAGQYENSSGHWELKNSILPSNAFFIDASTTIDNGGGYTWKSLPILSVYYNVNGGSISSDTYYLSSSIIYKTSNKAKLCHKWTYNLPQTNGFYDDTTFGIYKTGYKFVGWSTSASGGTVYDKKDNTVLPTDINSNIKDGSCSATMYAIWEKVKTEYTLSYNANGGSGAPSSQSGATSYTISSATPTKNGYTFLGWSTSSSATSAAYESGDSITLTQNTTLYAVWQEIPVYNVYNLIYDANGGTNAPEAEIFTEGEIMYISNEIPTRFGYVFDGWEGTYGFYAPGEEVAFYENTTLKANWRNYTILEGDSVLLYVGGNVKEFYMEFEPKKSGSYVFATKYTDDKLDTMGTLYDASANLLDYSDDINGYNFEIIYYLEAGQTYYICVESYNNTEGSSVLTLSYADEPTTNPDEPTTNPDEPTTNPDEPTTNPDPEPTPDPEPDLHIEIVKPSKTKINYKNGIILHAKVTGELPKGAMVVWETSNGNFSVDREDVSSCKIISKDNGLTDITVKIVGADGEILAEDYVTMTSNAGFFQKIIVFFKGLFGILPEVLPQAFKKMF